MRSENMKSNVHGWSAWISALALAATVSACGGGGGGSGGSVPPATDPSALNESQGINLGSVNNLPEVPSTVDLSAYSEAELVRAMRATRSRTQQRIGANLNHVRHYTATQEYNDLVMAAPSFGSTAVPDSSDAKLTAEGWPEGDFGIMLWHDQGATKGLGTPALGVAGAKYYTVVYKGNATVSVVNSPAKLGAPDTTTLPGKTIIPLSFPEGAANLSLAFVLKKDVSGKALQPVTDLQVLRPGVDLKNPPMFTDAFLSHLAPFSTIRFMDWLDTNADLGSSYDGPEGVWEKRPTAITKRTSSGNNVPRGQPWERIVELSNKTGVDIWINIPPAADETYALKLAQFLRDSTTGLKYGQNIYVEYGNEMWNSQFKAARKLWVEGVAEVSAGTALGKRLDYDFKTKLNGRPYVDYQVEYGARLYVDRLVRFSNAFRSVFNDEQSRTRIRPVLTWQIVSPGSTSQLLDYVSVNYGEPADYFYAVSGAPYYGMALADTESTKALYQSGLKVGKTSAELQAAPYVVSPNYILESFTRGLQENPSTQWYEANVVMARKHKLKWIAYEGGPDTFGPASYLNKAIASRDPKMFDFCQTHLNTWAASGGDLFMWFLAGAGTWDSVYGTYPLLEHLGVNDGEPGSHKYMCMKWASKTDAPLATSRHVLPEEINVPYSFSAGEITVNGGDRSLQKNDFSTAKLWGAKDQSQDYVLTAKAEACYALKLRLKNTAFSKTLTALPFKVLINGVAVDSPADPALANVKVGPMSDLVDVPYPNGDICVPAGISALTLVATQNTALTLDQLVFTRVK